MTTTNVAVSNRDKRHKPPQETNQPPMSSPSSFTSLPRDLVLNILVRLPKRLYPILCCVSKNLRSLVRSDEIQETRSSHGKDSLYICAKDATIDEENIFTDTYHWFNLRRVEKSNTENVLVSVDFSFLPETCRRSASVVAYGPEMFFIPGVNHYSSSFRIFDTQSGNVRQGPSLLAYRMHNCVALVGGKIYVIGGCREDDLIAESFDLKKEAWEPALRPHEEESRIWTYGIGAPLDRKVCAVSFVQGLTCYDTRDGSCESSELPFGMWWRSGVCVIDNVLFVYFTRFGLMWYDTELRLWRVVYDLDLDKPLGFVAMDEYYGKLAFLWRKPSLLFPGSIEIWCRMIGLARSEAGFSGAAEPSQLLRIVPPTFSFNHCLSVG
ncbi:PREDICTED: F-box/kelch-repeat protein At2g44700-like [Camelina sativa]|uniref:F-box/kelch-repeat protein At2g44700-like n=1 Tax=Camelina sativa TaxID=90675 RepID=A0ABM0ZAT6_CAMSA|nr:PREDICTED: F-box/kelch-repeat protein At2g44700-like [Camelina sativa]